MGSWGVETSVGCGGGDAESLEVVFGGGSAKSKWTGWYFPDFRNPEPTFGDWAQIYQLPSSTPSRSFDPNFCLPIRLQLFDTNLINACSESGLALPSGQIKIVPIAATVKRDPKLSTNGRTHLCHGHTITVEWSSSSSPQ